MFLSHSPLNWANFCAISSFAFPMAAWMASRTSSSAMESPPDARSSSKSQICSSNLNTSFSISWKKRRKRAC